MGLNLADSGEKGAGNAQNGGADGGGPYILKGEDATKILSPAVKMNLSEAYINTVFCAYRFD